MQPAGRTTQLPIYFFAQLDARVKALQAQGVDVIKLDIGSPDGPPPAFVVDALARSAADPTHHGYTGYWGTPALRQAFTGYYRERFGVMLDPDTQVLPLIGSKEGIAHLALAWLDRGDLALAPDPGYPTYAMGPALADAAVYTMPLLAANGFLPDLSAIPPEVARRARLMWLNYPNNPTGATAPLAFLADAVDFCRRYEILLCHDAPYADVCYAGYRAPSVLAVAGAEEVAIEFNSLSKSHNLAGWRIGYALGHAAAIKALAQVKSNVDSGLFLPIQDAAVAALTGDQSWIAQRNQEYQRRRDLLFDLVANTWGLEVSRPQASLYLWFKAPAGHSGASFAEKVLVETGVSITPGAAFGAHGADYLRISVGQTTPRVIEAVERLRTSRF